MNTNSWGSANASVYGNTAYGNYSGSSFSSLVYAPTAQVGVTVTMISADEAGRKALSTLLRSSRTAGKPKTVPKPLVGLTDDEFQSLMAKSADRPFQRWGGQHLWLNPFRHEQGSRVAHAIRYWAFDGPAHLLTMGPTRTGKGVGTIIPNMPTVDRSVICIDPKGENAKIAERARQKFGPVHVLDPFGITGKPPAAFNPLDTLEVAGLDIAEDASTLADALVFDEPGMSGEAHWNEEAKALISGLLLTIASVEPAGRRHLGTLREYLTLAPDAFAALLTRMQETDAAVDCPGCQPASR